MKKFLILSLVLGALLPFAVSAQSVDLLWEANTHTPPFYRGGAQWSYQSPITFVAIPHKLGNPSSLNYRWTNNGTVIGTISGVGKNTYSFIDSVVSRPKTIEVEIVSQNEEILAKNSVTIAASSPEVFVYENNPLYGLILHREISGTYDLKSGEVNLEAIPAFFGEDDYKDSAISYKWKSNAGETYTGKSATYRAPENTRGSSLISINISNGYRILQTANRNLLIKFGENDQ